MRNVIEIYFGNELESFRVIVDKQFHQRINGDVSGITKPTELIIETAHTII